jgi:hypothetical protein
MIVVLVPYFFVLFVFSVFSYGFIDLNLHLSLSPMFIAFQKPLETLVFHMRPIASSIFLFLLVMMSGYYVWFLKKGNAFFTTWKKTLTILIVVVGLLLCSFPAFTYDIFNYITTAKVAFHYHENPYLVMPIEIPNEPYLAFTRAANKVALYGPVWILVTAIPHYLGGGNIWLTIVMFKLMNVLGYIGFSYLIYRVTKSLKNVIFFALNPLVLIEVLVSGHNDIFMMVFAIAAFLLWEKKGIGNKIGAFVLFVASCLIKGASLVLLPLFFVNKISRDRLLLIAYCLMLFVFVVVAPLREELYPWYAVWLISIASLLDMKKHMTLIGFTIVLSFALELRQLPYMWMGYYEGIGPFLRILFTGIPLGIYWCYWFYAHKLRKHI